MLNESGKLWSYVIEWVIKIVIGLYLIPCLCLSNENKSIGGDDGEAEVNEDDWALRPNVPAGRWEETDKNNECSSYWTANMAANTI